MGTFSQFFILMVVINVIWGIQHCANEFENIVGVQQSKVQIGCDVGTEFSMCSLIRMNYPSKICSNEDCDIERLIYIGDGHICQFELYGLNVSGNMLN